MYSLVRNLLVVLGPKGEMNIQITSSLTSNTSTETITQNNFIVRNETSPNGSFDEAGKDRTLNEIYKTIDCIEEDANSDVILVTDCDDSEVIYIGEESAVEKKKRQSDIEPVILIDDDSVIEVPPTITQTVKNRKCNRQISIKNTPSCEATRLIRSNDVQNSNIVNTNLPSPIVHEKELRQMTTMVATSTPVRNAPDPNYM